MKTRYFAILSLAIVAMFSLAACSQAEEPTATTVPFEPTASGGSATATPTSSSGEPTATSEATPTEPSGGGDGDASNGESLFASNACSACHSTGDASGVGPGLGGIYGRAGGRVAGLDADAYIEQSIKEPGAFVVDGFGNVMSPFPNMSASDVADLQAYLRTLN